MSNTIRTYRAADLEAIVALINAADTFDQTEDGTSIEEMRDYLSRPALEPEENAFVSETEDGQIVGFGFVQLLKAEASSFRTWFAVHPSFRSRELEEEILNRLYRRAKERIDEVESGPVDFFCRADAPEHERIAAIERFGLHETRRFWRMVHDSFADLPEAHFPAGILTRAYQVPDDNVKMHEADIEIFRDHWGYSEQTLAMWEHYVAQTFVKPDLSIIAENAVTGEIAGFCVITINSEENNRLGKERGWIDILGVRRPYRHQGLGTALLLQGLANLRNAKADQAALGCDSENLTGATRIYERVGFRVNQTRMAFSKRMRE